MIVRKLIRTPTRSFIEKIKLREHEAERLGFEIDKTLNLKVKKNVFKLN